MYVIIRSDSWNPSKEVHSRLHVKRKDGKDSSRASSTSTSTNGFDAQLLTTKNWEFLSSFDANTFSFLFRIQCSIIIR